ncbi:MAG: GWxTD domain-containing protein [bacterium]|nr:GWxTD domain-containing protein [bacterium]
MTGPAVVVLVLLLAGAGRLGAQPVCSLDAFWCLGSPPLLEINLMLERASLQWTARDDGGEAAWRVRAVLEQGGRIALDTSWTRTDWRGAGEEVGRTEKLPDQVSLAAPPGGGRLRVAVADLAGGPAVEKTLRLAAADSTALLGGLVLGVAAPHVAEEGPFRRGGWRFLPYADALFGSGLDTLHALIQVGARPGADSLLLGLALLGERGNRLESRLPRPLASWPRSPDDEGLLALALSVGHLPSGAYHLEAELLDGEHSLGRLRKSFWMHNPAVEAPAPEPEGDDFSRAEPKELNRQWELARLLASHYEQEAWERQDLEGRRAFLRDFWRGRDPDGNTLVNEERLRLAARLEEAKRRWPQGGRGSELGDRARIFVRYGPPDAVETDFSLLNARFGYQLGSRDSQAGSGHRDFELWLYNRIEGGVEFIFIDLQGFGTFELVHSTKSGEYYDPQWGRKLFP